MLRGLVNTIDCGIDNIGSYQSIVTLLSVAPLCNFNNKLTTQYKTKIPPVGGAITFL